ncbi:MarR family winged helix-turn-helix transcriptional regulator [Sorangium sp. So ce1182]|uniref:MarR family winged helix-turn-helix transcriptional regulator n=1 Tax=Sorangium sp. So ce1182 TaxID=3133334 RepID=UPI003F5E6AE5
MQGEKRSESWDPRSSASFWINHASKALMRLQDGRLRPLGFGMRQMPVLHALGDGGSMSQKELARFAGVEQPTMAEMLARMERDGVVERAPDPKDGRASRTSLTRRALLRLPQLKEELIEVEREAMTGFSAAEKELLLTLLQRVARNLDNLGT